MKPQDFFTDQDDSLHTSFQMDPMGLEVIWTNLATNIYKSRVNSIVYDFRSYTLNLFHYYMVWRIRNELDPNEWEEYWQHVFESGDSPRFSKSLVILMENLCLYGFARENDENQKLNTHSMTGIANAKNNWSIVGKGPQSISLSLDPVQNNVLVRQLQFGFSGRYRTTFRNSLELLNQENDEPTDDAAKWEEIGSFFNRFQDFKQLQELLINASHKILTQKTKTKEFSLYWIDPDEQLRRTYVKCFAKPETLERRFAPYWKEKIKLHKDSTKWLWNTLFRADFVEDEMPNSVFFNEALNQAKRQNAEEAEWIGLEHVCQAEPYLTRVQRIFSGLLYKDNRDVKATTEWIRERWGDYPLRELASKINQSSLLYVLKGTQEGRSRLEKLLKLSEMPADQLLIGILKYHRGIAEYRKSLPWVEVTNDSLVKSSILHDDPFPKDKQSENEGKWLHSYFTTNFSLLANAIQRGSHETA